MLFAGVALLVTSCANEKEISVGGLEKNEVAFSLSAAQTRSVAKSAQKGLLLSRWIMEKCSIWKRPLNRSTKE